MGDLLDHPFRVPDLVAKEHHFADHWEDVGNQLGLCIEKKSMDMGDALESHRRRRNRKARPKYELFSGADH